MIRPAFAALAIVLASAMPASADDSCMIIAANEAAADVVCSIDGQAMDGVLVYAESVLSGVVGSTTAGMMRVLIVGVFPSMSSGVEFTCASDGEKIVCR